MMLTEKELDQIYVKRAGIEHQSLLKFTRRSMIILAILVVSNLVFGGLSIYLLQSYSHESKARSESIQHSRYDAFYNLCTNADKNHQLAIKRLSVTTKNRRYVVSLIDALVPYTPDCRAHARQQTQADG